MNLQKTWKILRNKQQTKLQKYIPENGALKKSFVITNQKLESWKLMIKQKKK